ncbi:MAG: helix-turn-helix domain-containing protein [Acidobacteria bacterium]|nr:helix-turn-helix domain-containing protein [Acidobacteriota bacterium]
MKRTPVDDNEKRDIGARIKRLRKEAGLRQWQLAELIGATQPAIHMYERGVLPEPKRLLELAKIGNTTVEWILTGRHWESGSPEMPRVPREIYELAFKFRDYSEEDRESLGSALETINSTVEAIQKAEKEDFEKLSIEEIAQRIKDFSRETRRALSAALEIHYAVYKALLDQGVDRMKTSTLYDQGKEYVEDASERSEKGKGRRPVFMRANSLEAIRGHIFKLDASLLAINDILRDKELRKEFEESLTKLYAKLEGKHKKSARARGRKVAAR